VLAPTPETTNEVVFAISADSETIRTASSSHNASSSSLYLISHSPHLV